jgi:hypothetical protein
MVCAAFDEISVGMGSFPRRLKPQFNVVADGATEVAPLQSGKL